MITNEQLLILILLTIGGITYKIAERKIEKRGEPNDKSIQKANINKRSKTIYTGRDMGGRK